MHKLNYMLQTILISLRTLPKVRAPLGMPLLHPSGTPSYTWQSDDSMFIGSVLKKRLRTIQNSTSASSQVSRDWSSLIITSMLLIRNHHQLNDCVTGSLWIWQLTQQNLTESSLNALKMLGFVFLRHSTLGILYRAFAHGSATEKSSLIGGTGTPRAPSSCAMQAASRQS